MIPHCGKAGITRPDQERLLNRDQPILTDETVSSFLFVLNGGICDLGPGSGVAF